MAKYTSKLNLKKPEQNDFYNVDDFNGNFDIIDEKLGEAYTADNKPTSDDIKAPKMFTYGETNKYATVLDACNALKYGGGFVASAYAPMSSASDYPKPGFELVFNVIGEANEARKTVLAYGYHGGKMNIYQRDIFREQWETEWKSTDEVYLSLSGGTLTGNVIIKKSLPRIQMNDSSNSRYGVFEIGADGYVSIGNWQSASDQYNLQIRKPSDGLEEAIRLTVNGANTYKIYGEHNLPSPAKVQSGSYVGTGTHGSANKCRLELNFQPKIVEIYDYSDVSTKYDRITLVYDADKAIALHTGFSPSGTSYYDNTVTWGDKWVEWYADAASRQLNSSNTTYKWVAIG